MGTVWQVVWNSKMREQLLTQMEAARSDSAAALPPAEFQYAAIQVRSNIGTLSWLYASGHSSWTSDGAFSGAESLARLLSNGIDFHLRRETCR